MERRVLENYSEKIKALGHPVRLRIAFELLDHDFTVNEICRKLSIAQATISQHLSILRNRGVIIGNRNGTSISYGLASNNMKEMLMQLKKSINDSSVPAKDSKSKSTTFKNTI